MAIHGTGTAALVGLPGLTLSGTVTVDVNDTGQAVNDSYTFTDGTSVSITFATGTHVERVTGTNLTIDAAGIFKIKGNVVFNLKPGGRVDVDVTSAEISLSVPINGTLTKVFSLGGNASFSFGGDSGFQLRSISLSNITIFGQTLTLSSSGASAPPVTELADPFEGQNVQDTALNQAGHIDVNYSSPSGAGLDVASITGSGPKIVISGPGVATTLALSSATQPDPVNNPTLFRYTFSCPSAPKCFDGAAPGTVQVRFLAGAASDIQGNNSDASMQEFYLYDPPTPTPAPAIAKTRLSSPQNGANVSLQTLTAREAQTVNGTEGYIDVTFDAAGGTVFGVCDDPSGTCTLIAANALMQASAAQLVDTRLGKLADGLDEEWTDWIIAQLLLRERGISANPPARQKPGLLLRRG